ncbi:hypothetical protein ACWGRF_28865 [Streptomyces zhihengii]
MEDRPAAQRLAAELNDLKEKSGYTYAQIKKQGERQVPPVKLDGPKLSNWLQGTNLPEQGPAFDRLIDILEAAAGRRTGLAPRGRGHWRDLRAAAEKERKAGIAAPLARPEDRAEPIPEVGLDGAAHADDEEKAQQLLKLLPPHGDWLKQLTKMPVMFRVPLAVSDPVCDALDELTVDPYDYDDPKVQAVYDKFRDALEALCDELNGMTDVSDEGRPVLEMSYPGSSAERNELNRQACAARDAFVPAYKEMVNTLKSRGWVTRRSTLDRTPAADGPVLTVALETAFTLVNGAVMTIPVSPRLPRGTGLGGPYFLVVKAQNKSSASVEIVTACIDIDAGQTNGIDLPYMFPAGGPGGRLQIPYRLGSHAQFQAFANLPEVDWIIQQVKNAGGTVRAVRPWVTTGAGERVEGEWTRVGDLFPLLEAARRYARDDHSGGASAPGLGGAM